MCDCVFIPPFFLHPFAQQEFIYSLKKHTKGHFLIWGKRAGAQAPFGPYVCTCLPGCVSCARLIDTITELEGWISTLYQIQEAEQILDTITFGPAITNKTCSGKPNATSVEVTSHPESSVTIHQGPADTPPPVTTPNDYWLRLRAKPKTLISSTPSHHKLRKLFGGRRRGRRSPPAASIYYNIHLKNKNELLNDCAAVRERKGAVILLQYLFCIPQRGLTGKQ